MKVKITRNTVANGTPVMIGEVVEMSENEARFLIAIMKAEAVNSPMPSPIERCDTDIEITDARVEVEKAIKPRVKK